MNEYMNEVWSMASSNPGGLLASAFNVIVFGGGVLWLLSTFFTAIFGGYHQPLVIRKRWDNDTGVRILFDDAGNEVPPDATWRTDSPQTRQARGWVLRPAWAFGLILLLILIAEVV